MGKQIKKNVRDDCIFRYKDCQGRYVCNNAGYEVSDECIKYYGLSKFASIARPNDDTIGGFILPENNTKCRGCKYYSNDYQSYIKRCKELGIKQTH